MYETRNLRDGPEVSDEDGESPEAPDFSLIDTTGRTVRLSDYRSRKHVVLVFNRGFT